MRTVYFAPSPQPDRPWKERSLRGSFSLGLPDVAVLPPGCAEQVSSVQPLRSLLGLQLLCPPQGDSQEPRWPHRALPAQHQAWGSRNQTLPSLARLELDTRRNTGGQLMGRPGRPGVEGGSGPGCLGIAAVGPGAGGVCPGLTVHCHRGPGRAGGTAGGPGVLVHAAGHSSQRSGALTEVSAERGGVSCRASQDSMGPTLPPAGPPGPQPWPSVGLEPTITQGWGAPLLLLERPCR